MGMEVYWKGIVIWKSLIRALQEQVSRSNFHDLLYSTHPYDSPLRGCR